MARLGKLDVRGLRELQTKLNRLKSEQIKQFVEGCAKELAARLLALVIPRTPVGKYNKYTGVQGGTLRRGWTAKTHIEAQSDKNVDPQAYANSLEIKNDGEKLVIEIINPVEYASYVEYGHRTRNHKGWVEGRHMMTESVSELQVIAPKVLEARIKRFLENIL